MKKSYFKKGYFYTTTDGGMTIHVNSVDKEKNLLFFHVKGNRKLRVARITEYETHERVYVTNKAIMSWCVDNLNELRKGGLASQLAKELNERHS